MLYDVRYLNRARATPGIAHDMTTSSKREALERARTMRDRGQPAHVVNMYGDTITD